MAVIRHEKTPQGELDYGIDWRDWLTSPDVVVNAEWSADPIGLQFSAPSLEDDGTKTWIFIGAGEEGTTYTVSATIFTDNDPPRTASRSFLLTVRSPLFLETEDNGTN